MSRQQDPHAEETLGKAYDSRLLRRLIRYVRPYWRQATLAVGLIILSALLQLVGPLAMAVALDLFITPPSEGRAVSQISSQVAGWLGELPPPEVGIAWCSGIFLASLLLVFVVLYAQAYVMQVMGQRILFDLRAEIFGHLQRLPMSYFDRNPIGRLVTRATTDVEALNELFTAGLVSIFGDIVLLTGIVGVLFWLDWRLALVSFAILPLLFALTTWFKSKARHWYREIRVRVARINAFLSEHITGMQVVQLFNREQAANDEFHAITQDHRDAHVSAIFYYAVYYPSVELITALGTGLIIWYGGGQVMAGVLSLGALVAFLEYAQRFFRPLADLSEKYNILQGAMASSERIFRLLDSPAAPEAASTTAPDAYRPSVRAAGSTAPRGVEGAIAFENVSFHYKVGEPVIRDLSFRVEPGQTVAIVGHTGAGKSTLANLILRFYDVTAGAVKVDGVDVRRWDVRHLRRSVGMVLQDVFLFAGSVEQNLHLGSQEMDRSHLAWAASEVQALDFIERLPEGFEAKIRERGGGLSVGQKQLLSFARALAFDPRILILDEATSSIDTETEQKIQAALDRLLEGRTSLVIAHRLSTIQKADRILVLHRGELREEGTHQDLLAQRGIYYRLYQLQYREQEVA